MRRFTFEAPGVPPPCLSPNASRHTHWGTKSRAKEQMREDWGWSIKSEWGKSIIPLEPMFTGPVTCKITVYWPPRRHGMDGDNLLACLKWGIDQIEKQGIVENDRQLSFLPIVQEKDPEKKGKVVVELEGE